MSETSFPRGKNVVYWDGSDESGRINEAYNGVYDVQGKLVAPGAYRVRGLEPVMNFVSKSAEKPQYL